MLTEKELYETLNDKQKAYVNFEIPNEKNGEYMLGIFHLVPGGSLNILQAAAEVAAEASTGTNFKVNTETAFSREMNALVYKLDQEKNLVWIAFPWRF
jgi:ribulose-bisphosphate carboxylase large chain